MHFSTIVLGFVALASGIQAAHIPRVTAAPQYEGLVSRSNPVEDALCNVLTFCKKNVTVTATVSTTTTLAPSTVVVTSTSVTSTTVIATTTVAGSCTTGTVAVFDSYGDNVVGYVRSTSPISSTRDATYSNALKVTGVFSSTTHTNNLHIVGSNLFFGLSSTSSTVGGSSSGSANLATVSDTSSATTIPSIDSAGNKFESNIWTFIPHADFVGRTYTLIYPGWASGGVQNIGIPVWMSSTGDLTVSSTQPAGATRVVLGLVGSDFA